MGRRTSISINVPTLDNEDNSLFSTNSRLEEDEQNLQKSFKKKTTTKPKLDENKKNMSVWDLENKKRPPRFSHNDVINRESHSRKKDEFLSKPRPINKKFGSFKNKQKDSKNLFKSFNNNFLSSLKSKYKTNKLKPFRAKKGKSKASISSFNKIEKKESIQKILKNNEVALNRSEKKEIPIERNIVFADDNDDVMNYASNIQNRTSMFGFENNYISNRIQSNVYLQEPEFPRKKQIKFSVQSNGLFQKRINTRPASAIKNDFLTPRIFQKNTNSINKKLWSKDRTTTNTIVSNNWQKPSKIFLIYKFNLDTNGLLYYLGSKGGNEEYSNPFKKKEISVFTSSLQHGEYSDFVDRSDNECLTKNEQNSFLGVDLGKDRSG